jgi:SAM-dependent methyltransferase
MATPTFPKRDPAEAQFWDLRYEACFAPWDAGRVQAQLRAFVESAASTRSVLVPGCGSAWEVRHLAERGWPVRGIDFSPAAVAAARTVLGPFADRVQQADFFAPIEGQPFDVMYERAFLCAMPRRMWTRWAARAAQVVRVGGELAGYFLFGEGEHGPPFPLHSQAELAALLQPAFESVEDAAVDDSIPAFQGRERWQRWRRVQ